MCLAYLWCVLLVCFPGGLYAAQSAAQSCLAPSLDGGYLTPEQDTYSDGSTLTYSCNNTRKPAVEGWWATSTCQNGKWTPEPRCIDENACLPLKITNAEYTENSKGWYEEGNEIRITCDEGYEALDVKAACLKGAWSSVPVCEKSVHSCGEPPKIPHAVVAGQTYKTVFAVDSVVQYECRTGFTVEGAERTKTINCISGEWTEGPTCRSALQPVAVSNCGSRPRVVDGDVVESDEWFLKYSCNDFYTLKGPEEVLCYSDGSWSQTPICRATFCSLNTDDLEDLDPAGVVFLKDGEKKELSCKREDYFFDYKSVATCTYRRVTRTRCCNWAQRMLGLC